MIAVHLLALAGLVAATASRVLPQAGWVYRAPRLGLAAWYTVLTAVVASIAGALLSLFVRLPATRDMVCTWWARCIDALTGAMGTTARLVGWAAVGVLALLAARAAMAVGRTVQTGLRRHREQVVLLRLVGQRDESLGAVVVDDPRPAAYALPGRSGTVVVTSGAVRSLPPAQLAAVLAHERAHTTGRHHLLAQAVRLLAAGFPNVTVFALARTQIDRLIEMRADDVAACGHARIELARALVACAEAATTPGPRLAAPVGAAAVTGGDALERVHRLLTPPAPLSRLGRTAVGVGLLAVAATPVLVAVFSTLAACLPPA